jgi:hypothetical protein
VKPLRLDPVRVERIVDSLDADRYLTELARYRAEICRLRWAQRVHARRTHRKPGTWRIRRSP